MRKNLKDLAKIVGGEISGDPDVVISGVSTIESAKEGNLTFALDPKSVSSADNSKAAAFVAPLKSKTKKPAILVKNPRLALAKILELFQHPGRAQKGIHKTAVIHPTAKIGKRTAIFPGVYVGEGSVIGDDCIIYPNAVIYHDVKIGNSVIINAGAVIGVSGFGFAQDSDGRHVKIPQIGGVVIEDDVEIYANTCISRGTMGNTIIGRGTKIDNLTHIAHNCVVGEDSALTALLGFAGGVKIGNRVYIGGQAGFNNNVSVGDETIIMAKSGVTKDIPSKSIVSGFPAQEHRKEMELQANIRKVPDLLKRIAELEKLLKDRSK
jgi:UDP-3-O-[3-hydroxymyristoyl] glucosamine N-acyltransferase